MINNVILKCDFWATAMRNAELHIIGQQ